MQKQSLRQSNTRHLVCVPATEVNEKALQAFADKLKELTQTLAAFVSPDNIEETLALITNGGLRLIGKN